MAALARPATWLPCEDCLQGELVRDVRHECVAGKAYLDGTPSSLDQTDADVEP